MRTKRDGIRLSLGLAVAVALSIASQDSEAEPAKPKVGEALRVDTERAARVRPSLLETKSGPIPFYAAADATTPKPAVVLLHGMCGAPENACPFFADGGRDVGHLVCPRANRSCSGGGSIWGGTLEERKAVIDEAVNSLRNHEGAQLDDHGAVLAGFSQGAFLALEIASQGESAYQGLLLVGAHVKPNRKKLEAAGIKRVVLAAGAYDGARPAMEEEAKRLEGGAIAVRFVSLGAVPHTYVEESPGAIARSLRWLGGGAKDPNDDE